jgi:hypothetical protein
MKISALFICVIAGTALAQSQQPSALPPDVLASQYFPSGVFDTYTHSSNDKWYACTLAALREPSLFAMRNDKSAEVYRFLWLPSFHRPISVRLIINVEGTGTIVTRSVDTHAGLLTKPASDTGKLIIDTTTAVDKAQVQDVLGQLQGLAFWSMPSEKEEASPQSSGTPTLRVAGVDGSQWVLEGVRRGEYHVVDRWSPHDDAYSRVCKHLLGLANVDAALY